MLQYPVDRHAAWLSLISCFGLVTTLTPTATAITDTNKLETTRPCLIDLWTEFPFIVTFSPPIILTFFTKKVRQRITTALQKEYYYLSVNTMCFI